MKKKFSTYWNSSVQPRKQRKFRVNAPLHVKRKFMSVNLSKELRKTQGKRNILVRKGDTVRVMRGKFKKKTGKVQEVDYQNLRVIIEGLQRSKKDGSKSNVPFRPSILQITALDLGDKKRLNASKKLKDKKLKSEDKTEKKNAP